jgi:L-alanine-DL-glutamate epimerase-like enolase superfamily enzyme
VRSPGSAVVKIERLSASVHEFPVTIPLIDEPIEQRRVVICEVETDDGITGIGLTGHFLVFAVVAALERHFLPLVKGMDPRDVEAIHDRVWKVLNPRAMTGVVSSALSCLDIALWDIHGKATGRSVAQLLGGHRTQVPSYVTFGFPEYDIEQLAEAARLHVKNGHKRLKLVVGVASGGYSEDARRVRAVRNAVGRDVELMLDANYMLSPVEALLLCRLIEDCEITWFEEPLYQNDARAMADLRRRTRIPISGGQMEGHRWRLRELVEHQAVDILQPNVCYCGGYTEARKAAYLAQSYNLLIANGGGWPRFNMHLQAGVLNGWRVEFHLGMQSVEDRIFVNPPVPHDNSVTIPTAPGLGLEIRREVVKDSLVRP